MEDLLPDVPYPDPLGYQHLVNFLSLQRAWNRPRLRGRRFIRSSKPTMFVINHSVMGIESLMIIGELYRAKNILARGLVEKKPFENGLFKGFMGSMGYVEGTREACATLMARNEFVLVAPGGGREVMKKKGEAYQLFWENRLGFVRMAVKFGYTLTPLAIIGPDESVDVVWDREQIIESPIGDFFRKSGLMDGWLNEGKYIFPIVKGVGWSPIPRPVKFTFRAGEPIETTHLQGNIEDREALLEIKEEVKRRLLSEIEIGRGED